MFYVIEAVRWTDGQISHVRWHTVDAPEDQAVIVKSDSAVVPVVNAATVCNSAEVRVYVDGEPGRFFKMKACPDGIDAEADEYGTALRERMGHLPPF